jgi:L-asparaginase II
MDHLLEHKANMFHPAGQESMQVRCGAPWISAATKVLIEIAFLQAQGLSRRGHAP